MYRENISYELDTIVAMCYENFSASGFKSWFFSPQYLDYSEHYASVGAVVPT